MSISKLNTCFVFAAVYFFLGACGSSPENNTISSNVSSSAQKTDQSGSACMDKANKNEAEQKKKLKGPYPKKVIRAQGKWIVVTTIDQEEALISEQASEYFAECVGGRH